MKITLVPAPPKPTPQELQTNPEIVVLRPAILEITRRPLRVLDFDCECRPLHWIGGDYVSREITAIAWAWIETPQPEATVVLLGENDMTVPEMIRQFAEAYSKADLVTGHFIRGFDLPLINSALVENQMPTLEDKMTHDTKLDLLRFSGLSKSQENLGASLGLAHPKVHMNQQRWREANRLTPEGLAYVRERVAGDVLQHIEMRQKLLDLGYLAPPVKWQSKGEKPLAQYQP
jgi:hypothetical protein